MSGFLKKNWKSILVSFLVFMIMLLGTLENINFFSIMKRAIFEPDFIQSVFMHTEVEAYRSWNPTILNLVRYLIETTWQHDFDTAIVLSTMWMQLVIPLFVIPSCIQFYRLYHSSFKFTYPRKRQSYQKILFHEIFVSVLKAAAAIFMGYFLFMIFMWFASSHSCQEPRSLFSDLLGSSFYKNHQFIYYLLEGFVRFFAVPFVYAWLGHAVALFDISLKFVIATPIAYYYGLSAIGYALDLSYPVLAMYFNPTVLMANGSYDFNTLLMLLTNGIPLYIGLGLTKWKCSHVEI